MPAQAKTGIAERHRDQSRDQTAAEHAEPRSTPNLVNKGRWCSAEPEYTRGRARSARNNREDIQLCDNAAYISVSTMMFWT